MVAGEYKGVRQPPLSEAWTWTFLRSPEPPFDIGQNGHMRMPVAQTTMTKYDGYLLRSTGRYRDNSEGETRQAAPLLEGRQQSGRQSLSASASSRSLNSHEGACSLTSLLPRQPKKAAADAWCSADRLSRCLTAPPPQGGPCGKQRSRPTRKRTQHGGERRTVGPSR